MRGKEWESKAIDCDSEEGWSRRHFFFFCVVLKFGPNFFRMEAKTTKTRRWWLAIIQSAMTELLSTAVPSRRGDEIPRLRNGDGGEGTWSRDLCY